MCSVAVPAVIGAGLQLANAALQAQDDGSDAREAAKDLAARGAREADLVRRDGARARAQQRVALLKGGVTAAGSPTDLLLNQAEETERDAEWARLGYRQAARDKEREARRSRRRGMLDELSTVNNLGSNLLSLKKQGVLEWS